MILFEANAVAPLVKLPDAAKEERVQLEMVGLMATARGEKVPLRKTPPLHKTQERGHPTAKAQSKGVNTKVREGCGAGGELGIQCGQSLAGSQLLLNGAQSGDTMATAVAGSTVKVRAG